MTANSNELSKSDIESPPYSLGGRIKLLRDSRKLSQAELARIASLSQSTVAQIETGRNADPTFSTLKKIANALEVDIAVLFATADVHVFDMPRLRARHTSVDQLTPFLYMALSKVVQYAEDIGLINE